MFTATDFQAHLRATPFVPFRVTTSAGQSYDITHPEFVLVMRRFLEIGVFGPEDPNFPEYAQRVSILHVTSVDDLPRPAGAPAAGANGPAAGPPSG